MYTYIKVIWESSREITIQLIAAFLLGDSDSWGREEVISYLQPTNI